MKNILLLVHDDDGQEARLQVALDITRALSGHLTCVVAIAPPLALSSVEPGIVQSLAIAEACERERHNFAKLEARLANEDVAWNAIEAIGDPARKLQNAAGLADLIVVSSRLGQDGRADARRIVGALAVKSGRAILAVPPGAQGLNAAGQVLVAWDGSPEANAALRAAIPLLRHAQQVTLLEVNLPDRAFAAEEAASYLSRHQIRAEVVERITDGPISDIILAEAIRLEAAYIVMGAYGHGRAVDALFGGVSGGMLAKSEFPLLLRH